jgi:hypothetical protein
MRKPAIHKNIIAAAAVLALALASPAVLASGADELVQLRIKSDHKNAVVEIPLPVLEFLQKHDVGKKIDAGEVHGRRIHVSLDQIMKALKDTRAKGGETLLMKVEEPGETTTIFLAVATDASSRPGKTPTTVVLTAKDPHKDGPTRITVPLSTVDMLVGSLKIEGDDGEGHGHDPMPLFRDLLSFARDMGTGLLARVQSDDGEVVLELQ